MAVWHKAWKLVQVQWGQLALELMLQYIIYYKYSIKEKKITVLFVVKKKQL